VTSTTDTFGDFGKPGAGWITYASIMLGLAGIFSVIDGIVALSRSKFFVADASYVFSDLRTWGWIVLVVGALEIFASVYVTRGSEFARWFGVGAASLNGIAQLMFLPGYPLWAVAAFAMDILIVYGLIVYGGARLKMPA
jgi:hypothetical protein